MTTTLGMITRDYYTVGEQKTHHPKRMTKRAKLLLNELKGGKVMCREFCKQHKIDHANMPTILQSIPDDIGVYDDKDDSYLFIDCLNRDRIDEVLNGV